MLDLSGFAAHLPPGGRLGPRLLVAIWIWAYSERMSSGALKAAIGRSCIVRHGGRHPHSFGFSGIPLALENLLTQQADLEQVRRRGSGRKPRAGRRGVRRSSGISNKRAKRCVNSRKKPTTRVRIGGSGGA